MAGASSHHLTPCSSEQPSQQEGGAKGTLCGKAPPNRMLRCPPPEPSRLSPAPVPASPQFTRPAPASLRKLLVLGVGGWGREGIVGGRGGSPPGSLQPSLPLAPSPAGLAPL